MPVTAVFAVVAEVHDSDTYRDTGDGSEARCGYKSGIEVRVLWGLGGRRRRVQSPPFNISSLLLPVDLADKPARAILLVTVY